VQVVQAQVVQLQAEVAAVEDDINFAVHYLIKKEAISNEMASFFNCTL
jgi:hypothetical protein